MVSRELVAALTAARRGVTREVWRQLTVRLAGLESRPNPSFARQATAAMVNRDAASILAEAFERVNSAKWSEIAAAMTVVDCYTTDDEPIAEIIWTGPANNRFPVRRIDQVLYDLISKARTRIVLVTFAANRVGHLCDHLTRAVGRGVELTLIVESEGESEGQLTRDAMEAFNQVPTATTRLYYWPLKKRERNHAGRPGKLHVKCAIIDDLAIIGSANLTDDAFNRNMELGILVRERFIVESVAQHFLGLIQANVLVPVPQVKRRSV